jgi:hypothetical protein
MDRTLQNLCYDPGEENAPEEDHTGKTVGEISMEELESAIQGLKNRKAPGLDGINLELLKYGGITLKLRLLHLLHLSWKYFIIPSARQKAKIIFLFKKGKRNSCENYWGISLLATSYKIYAKTLNKRLMNISDVLLLEEQNGFRKRQSCTDYIFTVTQIIEKCREFNLEMHITFIDYEKTFDRVSQATLANYGEKRLPTTSNMFHQVSIPVYYTLYYSNSGHGRKIFKRY